MVSNKGMCMSNEESSGLEIYLGYLREHWALAASLGYLYLTLLGMAQSGVLFAKCRVSDDCPTRRSWRACGAYCGV